MRSSTALNVMEWTTPDMLELPSIFAQQSTGPSDILREVLASETDQTSNEETKEPEESWTAVLHHLWTRGQRTQNC